MNRSDFMCIDRTFFGRDVNQTFVQDTTRCRTLVHTAMHDAESTCSPGQHLNFAPSMENAFKAPFGRCSSNCMSRESCTNRTHLPEWWCHVQSTGSGSTPPSPTRSLPVSANSSITEVNTELSHLVVHVYNGKARNARKCSQASLSFGEGAC